MVSPALEQLARDLAGTVKLVKVDVDPAPKLSERFTVRAVPTLLVLRDGRVVARQAGAAPVTELRGWLDGALASAGRRQEGRAAEMDAPTETPDHPGAFPRLSDGQIGGSALRKRRPTRAGTCCRRGRGPEFFVVLSGKVAGVDDERVAWVHGPGRFLGELGLLTGRVVPVSVVREAGEVLAVPARRLRELVAGDPELGDLILRAYLIRRCC